jgi:hypothetical protein
MLSQLQGRLTSKKVFQTPVCSLLLTFLELGNEFGVFEIDILEDCIGKVSELT